MLIFLEIDLVSFVRRIELKYLICVHVCTTSYYSSTSCALFFQNVGNYLPGTPFRTPITALNNAQVFRPYY